MRLTLLIFFFTFTTLHFCKAQDFASLWKAHYSYYNIVDVVSGENKIYAAAENAIFEYDVVNNEINTITTIEGLSGESITTIYYSNAYQYLLIGYETGLMEVYSETDNSVLSVVDILEKQNITPDNKQINHFYEHQGLVYISTNYGVSVYDLEGLEFGDTYFLGNAGQQIEVKQTTVLDNQLYVACLNNNGVKRASLSNSNLIDFMQWETIVTGDYHAVNTLNNKVYAVRSNRVVYEIDATSTNTLLTLPFLPLDAEVAQNNIIYTTNNAVRVYDANFQLVNSYQPITEYNTNFTAATQVNNTMYLGSNKFGVLSILNSETDTYTALRPDGPLENNIFKLNAESGDVWATYGVYSSSSFNPYPITRKGLSIYNEQQWKNIPYDSLLNAAELNEIAINPFNPNQAYVSSFFEGILVLENLEPTILFDNTNSGLESLIVSGSPNYIDIRISALKFDTNGLLWLLTSKADNALKSYDPVSGSWQSYSFSSLIADALNDENGFYDLAIDRNGTKWIGSQRNGLFALNENVNDTPLRSINSSSASVEQYTQFRALAIDNNQRLWIGTNFGLRVLNNPLGFYSDPNPQVDIIVIVEDGVPKELLEGQTITDIKVDGSNNKWIGTSDSGVFYFSSDGQQTIYHFTKDNSPLPSNSINDISLDTNTGEVYIATTKGLLSFNAGGSKPKETLENVYAYPNPVRPEYNILGHNDLNDINKGVKITGLTNRVNLKITDIEGNLVAEAQTNVNQRTSAANYNFAIDGGTAIWNGKNLANNVVRSGVYLIMISDLDTFETKVLKLLIIR